jgi:hypothetical protein
MKARRSRSGVSGVALLLVVVGVLVLWNKVGGWGPRSLFHLIATYWPCAFISIGVSNVFFNARKRLAPGIAFLLLGSFLQLVTLDWLPGDIGDYWPFVFIMAGLWLLLVRPGETVFGFEQHTEPAFEMEELFGSRSLRLLSQSLAGGSITATLAGIDVEAGDALPAGQAVIVLDTLLSGVKLHIPAHWRLSIEATSTLAVIRDKRTRPDPDAPADAPELVLRGSLLLSVLEVRNPLRTFAKRRRSVNAEKRTFV